MTRYASIVPCCLKTFCSEKRACVACNVVTFGIIIHIQSRTLHYNTFTARATTHRSPQRTFPPASTNDCHHYHPTRYHLTNIVGIVSKETAPPYQKALDESGYRYTLNYEPYAPTKRKNRQRNNILLYNPPFRKKKEPTSDTY